MTHRTPEQALEHSISVLGDEYGTAFHHCCQEFWRLSSMWDRYQTLFGSQERVDLLNRSSGLFWNVIQGMMHEHVLLAICRITDSAATRANRNLTLETLAALDPSPHKKRLIKRVESARNNALFARSWRNKRIAHNDFEQTIGLAHKILPSTGIKITRSIISIHEVLRWIKGKHFDGDMVLMDLGDDDSTALMTLIDDGLKYRTNENWLTPLDERYPWLRTGPSPERRYESRRPLKNPRPPKHRRST